MQQESYLQSNENRKTKEQTRDGGRACRLTNVAGSGVRDVS